MKRPPSVANKRNIINHTQGIEFLGTYKSLANSMIPEENDDFIKDIEIIKPLHTSTTEKDMHYRSLDNFLEKVYLSTSTFSKAPYFLIILSLAVANSSDATEILFISFTLSNPEFKSSMLEGGSGGIVAASVFSGMLLGGSFVGTFSDEFGRKPTLLIGLLINAVGGACSAISTNSSYLIATRFLAGIGIGASVPPLFTLMSELAPPHKRGEFITYVASFWMIGSLYVGVVAMVILEYLNWSWRIFALVCAFPSFLAFIMVHFFVPESPRYLALSGKETQATSVANSIASKMGFSSIDMRRGHLKVEEMVYHFNSTAKDHGVEQSLMDKRKELLKNISLLYSSHMLKATLSIQLIWFSLSFGTYGLIIWINTIFAQINPQSVYINAIIFAAANLPGNIFSAIFLDLIGRNVMLALSMLFSAVSLGFFALFSSQEFLSPLGVIICACSFQAFSTSAWNTIDVLSSEIFPTQIRSSGLGLCTAVGRIGAMVAQPINGMLVDRPVLLLGLGGITMLLGAVTPLLGEIGDQTGKPLSDEADESLIQHNAVEDEGIETTLETGKSLPGILT